MKFKDWQFIDDNTKKPDDKPVQPVSPKEDPLILSDNGFDYDITVKADGTAIIKEFKGNAASAMTVPAVIDEKKIVGIGKDAYRNTDEIQSLVIPEGVKSIAYCAFSSCHNLKSVTLPQSLVEIDAMAFYDTAIDSISLPNGLTYIGNNAFHHCPLTFVSIPPSVKVIGDEAFSGCKQLKNVVLSVGVQELGDAVFDGCHNLNELYIPRSVKKIGKADGEGLFGNLQFYFWNGSRKIKPQISCPTDAPCYDYVRKQNYLIWQLDTKQRTQTRPVSQPGPKPQPKPAPKAPPKSKPIPQSNPTSNPQTQNTPAHPNASTGVSKNIAAHYVKDTKKNSLDLYFDTTPSQDTIKLLRKNGWLLFSYKNCWHNKLTPESEEFAERICGGNPIVQNSLDETIQNNNQEPSQNRSEITSMPTTDKQYQLSSCCLSNSLFERDLVTERHLYIDNLQFYAYYFGGSCIRIVGEIFAKKIRQRIRINCVVYDKDGDVMSIGENSTYGNGWTTRLICPECFYDGFPFEVIIREIKPENIQKIKFVFVL